MSIPISSVFLERHRLQQDGAHLFPIGCAQAPGTFLNQAVVNREQFHAYDAILRQTRLGAPDPEVTGPTGVLRLGDLSHQRVPGAVIERQRTEDQCRPPFASR